MVDRIQMLTSHIAVRRDKPIKESPNGIIFSREEDQWTGTVLHVGPGLRGDDGQYQPMRVSVGDRILFRHHGTDKVDVAGETLDMMREDKVLAIIES